eukprot:41192-Pleurochrysis_carterae.AAC.1
MSRVRPSTSCNQSCMKSVTVSCNAERFAYPLLIMVVLLETYTRNSIKVNYLPQPVDTVGGCYALWHHPYTMRSQASLACGHIDEHQLCDNVMATLLITVKAST